MADPGEVFVDLAGDALRLLELFGEEFDLPIRPLRLLGLPILILGHVEPAVAGAAEQGHRREPEARGDPLLLPGNLLKFLRAEAVVVGRPQFGVAVARRRDDQPLDRERRVVALGAVVPEEGPERVVAETYRVERARVLPDHVAVAETVDRE